ncbi:hypothetical protein [Streptomyces xinghaiensis]|uniref:hypothetical protein n=1 Tax=Streptomyces xinghaiensis TaxID=1038928 RepID=UPI002E129D89|nr:hypothetical protein OG463_15340 [Streptomyces xinghaiensis]
MMQESPYERIREIANSAPKNLAIWKYGKSALPVALFEISRRRVTDKFERIKSGGPAGEDGEIGGKWASVAAHLVEWAFRYGNQSEERREPAEQDVVAAVDLAEKWKALDIAFNAGKAGRAKISQTKRGLWIDPLSDPRMEVLDILLEGVDTNAEPTPEVGPDLSPAITYLNSMRASMSGGSAAVPRGVVGLFVQHAKSNLRAQNWEVPRSTNIGGMTLDEVVPLLGTLWGIAHVGWEVFARYPSLTMANPAFKRSDLAEMITRYNPDSDKIELFLDLLTYQGQSGRSPLSAPLIQWSDTLIVTRHLLHDTLTERMVLRAASADPASSGKLGTALGNLCSRWATRLRDIPGVEVAEEVKIFDSGNKKLGDLDIVALDRGQMQGLIVEAKWPVDARTLSDARKQEDAIDKGRAQIERLQTRIGNDVKVKFPPGWPEFQDVQWEWIVGTARFLDSRRTESAIPSTSLRLVEALLPVSSLSELVDALENLSLPREGKDFRLDWEKVRIGRHLIHVRTIQMLRSRPTSPPLGRRLADGWT